jgi:hypothetical protein
MDRTLQFDLEWSDHIASNSRLCIFVGSGVSSGCRTDEGASPPNWADLIDELAVAYGCADLLQGGKLELQERAELVDRHRRSLGVTNMDFSSEIAKLVDCINGRLVRESVVHSTIADIDPPLIVTTNYDRILERYLNGSTEPGYNVWTYPGRV